jgi:hypothetical protein
MCLSFPCHPCFHRGREDDVAVIIIQDQDILATNERGCWESTFEVCIDLTGLHDGGIDKTALVLMYFRSGSWFHYLRLR